MKKEKDHYLQSIKFLESLANIPGPNHLKTGLEVDRSFFIDRTKYLLKLLGNPEKDFKYIHIAGTSGKSSLAYMIQAILTEAGLKTGAYFSPHATETTERMKVNNKNISPAELSELINWIKPYLSLCAKNGRYGVPSYFETLVAIAFLYFKKKKCEYIALETGCGGNFDATNIIPKTEIAVITNIGLDHTRILGNSKTKIAQNKAGIIKKNSILITGEKNPSISRIFQKICQEKNCQLKKINLDFQIIKNDLTGTKFKYEENVYETKAPGRHQIENAILAIEAARLIKNKNIDTTSIKNGLKKISPPCRLEVVQSKPTVILDGAHNADKLKSTADFIKNIKFKKLHLILGLAEDKELYNTLKYIIPLVDKIYLTRFLIPVRKSKNLKKMYKMAKELAKEKKDKIEIFVDPWQALEEALSKADKRDIILITGSFFLAGELRKKWIKSSLVR